MAAAVAANNLFQQWMPINMSASAAGSGGPNQPQSTPVVINVDGGAAASSGAQTAPVFQPAGGYSLIDINRLTRSNSNGSGADAPPPAASAADRPTQFDSVRAQILADLHSEPPQPNALPSRETGAGAGGGGGADASGPGADIFSQIPEARQLVDALMRYLPYVFILAIKCMIDHLDGILNVAVLVIMFSHANWIVRKQICRQKQRSVFALLRELAYVSVVLLFVGLMIGEWTWFEMFVTSDGRPTDWPLRTLLYTVLLTDLVAKLLTVHVKICVTLLPPCMVNYRNRVSEWWWWWCCCWRATRLLDAL